MSYNASSNSISFSTDNSVSTQLIELNRRFNEVDYSQEVSGMKRNSRGGLVKIAPDRRRMKARESVFVSPLFSINHPSNYTMMPNSDPRYKLPKQLQKALEVGNLGRFRQLLVDNFTSDFHYINQCDGLYNPFGPMVRELRGPSNVADFYDVMTQSVADTVSRMDDTRAFMDPTPFDPSTGRGGGAFVSVRVITGFSARRSVVVHNKDDTSKSDREYTSLGDTAMARPGVSRVSSTNSQGLEDSLDDLLATTTGIKSHLPVHTPITNTNTSNTTNTSERDKHCGISDLLLADEILMRSSADTLSAHVASSRSIASVDLVTTRSVDSDQQQTQSGDLVMDALGASLGQFSLAPVEAAQSITFCEGIYTYVFNGEGKVTKNGILFKWSAD